MAIVATREVMTFSLMGGAEVAEIGWSFSADTANPSMVTDLNAEKDLWWGAVRDRFSSATEMIERRLDVRNPATNVLTNTFPLDLPTDPTGANGLGWLPPQLSVVVSLRTGLPGRSYRGRVYLPGFSRSVLDDDGRLTTAARDDLAASTASYFAAIAGDPSLAVASVYSPTLHILTPITEVKVGDVFDTQRRRRNALVEAVKTEPV